MGQYRGKYLKTYFWSGLSLILSFFSMFIVAPLTTSMPEAYGVYSLCISFTIFLRYADLGFITAGRKYAAEAFSLGNYSKSKLYVGTSIFIYGIMVFGLFILALLGSLFPEYLIEGIENTSYYELSHKLLLILAFTFPFSIIQKFCSLIYSIRIEEYKVQCFQIFGSILKLVSVPLYFFNEKYDIVGYYFFCEFINLLTSLIVLFFSKRIGYGFIEMFRCLKFNKQVFQEISPLAFTGFTSVISWIAYYELDTVGISVLLGANAVAIYTIGKQIQTFVRSLIGIVFSPYPVRINYFIGQKDFNGLKTFYYKLAEFFSIVIIPIVIIVLFAKPFVISWVGQDYSESVMILQLLVLTFIFHYITSLGSSVLYGLNKVKDILKLSIFQPIIFWIGVFATYKIWGIYSFAVFKLIACFINELYTCYLTRKYLSYSKRIFYCHIMLKPLVFISLINITLWHLFKPNMMNVHKGHKDLILVVSVMAICCVLSLVTNLIYNQSLRNELKFVLRRK